MERKKNPGQQKQLRKRSPKWEDFHFSASQLTRAEVSNPRPRMAVNAAPHEIADLLKALIFFVHRCSLAFACLMCDPRPLFFSQCGPPVPKGWTSLKASVAETISNRCKYRHTEQWDGQASPVISPCLCGPLLFGKGVLAIRWRNGQAFQHRALGQPHTPLQKGPRSASRRTPK